MEKMKNHHEKSMHKAHPHHKGAGMPYFEAQHWQKDMKDVEYGGCRYSSEMNTPNEYKESVDKLASYAKSHRAKH
jgi:hypothetical protein